MNYKVLNSIAHNFGQSYVSSMSYSENDYTMGHILKYARLTGAPIFNINILNGMTEPVLPIDTKIYRIFKESPKNLKYFIDAEGASIESIKQAQMILSFDLSITKPHELNPDILETPYTLKVNITDDRDILHTSKITGWGFVEP